MKIWRQNGQWHLAKEGHLVQSGSFEKIMMLSKIAVLESKTREKERKEVPLLDNSFQLKGETA